MKDKVKQIYDVISKMSVELHEVGSDDKDLRDAIGDLNSAKLKIMGYFRNNRQTSNI